MPGEPQPQEDVVQGLVDKVQYLERRVRQLIGMSQKLIDDNLSLSEQLRQKDEEIASKEGSAADQQRLSFLRRGVEELSRCVPSGERHQQLLKSLVEESSCADEAFTEGSAAFTVVDSSVSPACEKQKVVTPATPSVLTVDPTDGSDAHFLEELGEYLNQSLLALGEPSLPAEAAPLPAAASDLLQENLRILQRLSEALFGTSQEKAALSALPVRLSLSDYLNAATPALAPLRLFVRRSRDSRLLRRFQTLFSALLDTSWVDEGAEVAVSADGEESGPMRLLANALRQLRVNQLSVLPPSL